MLLATLFTEDQGAEGSWLPVALLQLYLWPVTASLLYPPETQASLLPALGHDVESGGGWTVPCSCGQVGLDEASDE